MFWVDCCDIFFFILEKFMQKKKIFCLGIDRLLFQIFLKPTVFFFQINREKFELLFVSISGGNVVGLPINRFLEVGLLLDIWFWLLGIEK